MQLTLAGEVDGGRAGAIAANQSLQERRLRVKAAGHTTVAAALTHERTALRAAQFLVFEVHGKQRPLTGWPEDAFGVPGTVTAIEAGDSRPTLRRVDGVWKIERRVGEPAETQN